MRLAVQTLVCLLVAPLALATLLAAAAAIGRPISIDYGEPIVYVHAARVLRGEPLYQPIEQPPFTVAAYPPLYYWAAAALQQAVGPGFAPGRLLSLACGLASAVCVAYLAVGRTRDWLTAVLAALLFVAFGFPGDVPWLALYRVDLLGVVLSLACIVVLSRGASRRHILAAAVLAGLALLAKQTFFTAAVAGTLWLWTIDRRSMLVFALVVALTFGLPSVWLEVTTHAFLSNAIVANISPFATPMVWDLGREFVKTQGVPMLLALAYVAAARPWTMPADRLLLVYWAISAISLLGIAKVGANHNYWIELAAVTAALGARLPRMMSSHARLAAVTLALVVVGTAQQLPRVLDNVPFHIDQLRNADDYSHFEALVERVRTAPGAVLAEPLDVLALSGRAVLLEPLIYSLLLEGGTWDPGPMVASICNGQVAMVVLGYSLEEAARMGVSEYTVWPSAIVSAIDASMTLDSMDAGRFVYTPSYNSSPSPPCAP